MNRRTSTRDLMRATGWYTVKEQIRIATTTLTWKLVHNKKPARLLERIKIQDDYSLQIDRPRLQFSLKAYRWRAGEEWNALPQDMRQELSIASFKKRLKLLVTQDRNWDPGD